MPDDSFFEPAGKTFPGEQPSHIEGQLTLVEFVGSGGWDTSNLYTLRVDWLGLKWRTPLQAPERIRVAAHRQADGVFRLLTANETRQDHLWDVRDFVRVGHDAEARTADYDIAAGEQPLMTDLAQGLREGGKQDAGT